MKHLTAALALCGTLIAVPLTAQDNLVVVELFTSQGCSSCPPADALMQRVAQRDDVIALSLHVDYWDYIGWKDEFADPAFTKRQKAYAKVSGRRMIYTPQMIVGGRDDLVGAKGMELADLIAAHKDVVPLVTLDVRRDGHTVTIRLAPVAKPLDGPFDIQLVRYVPERLSHITRGENAGLDLRYVNVVDDWQLIGQWDGLGAMEVKAGFTGDRPGVVLVQKLGPGEIIAAAIAR